MHSLNSKQKFITKTIAATLALMVYGGEAHAEKALEEVIVTAQKKSETLQDVPMTVNAVTSETISKYNLLDFKDIQSVTPGLSIKEQDTRTSTIAMRGVNVLTDTGYGPGVAIYWNEVPTDIDSVFSAMYDIGQIEVLRGPQGTLRGITAPAGAVTIMTKTPSYNEIEGTVDQTFGDRDLSNTQFGMSLPIIEDKLSLRIAGLYDHNKTSGIRNLVNGKENSSETRSGRISLGLRPTENIEATLTHQYTETMRAGNQAMEGCGNQSNVSDCLSAGNRKSVNAYQNTTFFRRNDTSLRIEWNMDKYMLTSVTGYLDRFNNVFVDQDIGNALPPGTLQSDLVTPASQRQTVVTYDRTFSQEVRFSTEDADFYNWTYGVYGARQETNTIVNQEAFLNYFLDLGGGAFYPAGSGTAPVNVFIPSVLEQYAFFTNQSLQLTDALEAQAGIRYQSQRSVQRMDINYGGISYQWRPNNAIDEGVTGTASLFYQLTDDMNVYATYGRSFRSGGFTTAPSTPGVYTEYQPETSDSIELGFKSRLADGRVQVNADVYYQKYHDFLARTAQGVRTIHVDYANPANSTLGNDFLNYNADAVSQGAEVQIDALLTDNWQAGLGISYNDAKFTGGKAYCNLYDANGIVINPTPDANGNGVNTCDAKGRLSGEPNWGVSASSEYTMHFGSVDSFVRAQYNFASGHSDDSVAGSVLDTSSYGLWNLFVGVRDPKKTWEVTAWAKNLFNHQQVIGRSPEYSLSGTGVALDPVTYQPTGNGVPDSVNLPLASGYGVVQVLPERQIGITGKYNFSL